MDMMTVSGVCKAFGSKKVIDNLHFSVPEHTIYGFIGKNGAGKTTTMKMILGLIPMDQGCIQVHGEPVQYGNCLTNRFIGYLPDVPEFYGYMTPKEYLAFCGEITGMPKNEAVKRTEQLLDLVGLSTENRRIQGFSRGMKQRLGIAQALLNRPKLLICDEPTSALDPIGRKEILDILLAAREETTVLFSTHILADVERICDEIGILHRGKIARKGTMEEIKAVGRQPGYEIEFKTPKDRDLFLSHSDGGRPVGSAQLIYENRTEEDMQKAMGLLHRLQLPIRRLEMRETSLEDLFMEVMDDETADSVS